MDISFYSPKAEQTYGATRTLTTPDVITMVAFCKFAIDYTTDYTNTHLKISRPGLNYVRIGSIYQRVVRTNGKSIWHEITTINNCNIHRPTCIEGVTGGKR